MEIFVEAGGRQDPSFWAGRGQVPWGSRVCSALRVGPDTVNVKQEPTGTSR